MQWFVHIKCSLDSSPHSLQRSRKKKVFPLIYLLISNLRWIYFSIFYFIVATGKVLVETSLPFNSYEYSTIVSVKPIAVPVSERSQFTVKGFNLSTPLARYALCYCCALGILCVCVIILNLLFVDGHPTVSPLGSNFCITVSL